MADYASHLEALDDLVDSLEEEFGESDDDSESLDGRSMKTTFGHVRKARDALISLRGLET